MEFLGHSPTAVYLGAARRQNETSKLPNIASLPPVSNDQQKYGQFDYPFSRALTTLGYTPAKFYTSAKFDPNSSLTGSSPANVDTSNLSTLSGIRVPPIYSAARNALYTRYTQKNWYENYQRLLHANDRALKDSENLLYESGRRINEEIALTKANQDEATRKLGDRICDINYWINELEDEIDKMVKENNDLNRTKRIAEKLLTETENQLHIAQECLYNREKRQGIDLVHDNVEKKMVQVSLQMYLP
ncbi:unnamed protein product [Protopolystoma xenopodis]|uniref:Tektin n=1 Tax=Protopolystoma xenopodis TaxID=117903 RepID=A0A448WFT8_9PLAT|nr:unnamed protein product [Protopolystoma xenopodis]